MSTKLAETPLHDWHVSHGGRMVDFAGWSMPVQYSSIVEEHQATRNAVGLFDISHMGRLRFDGPGAAEYLDGLLTRRVVDLAPGRVAYSLVTNDQGGILDDVLVYHLVDGGGASYWMMVVNASNREKIVAWLNDHPPQPEQVVWSDVTRNWAMIAVQGPKSVALVNNFVEADVPSLKYYHAVETAIDKHGGIVSRSGYTGEDGVELIVGNLAVTDVWESLLAAGASQGAKPAGLGCRDTLRLEAAMPLYGHELNEQIDPFQAGLGFAVDLEGRDFPGRDALVRRKEDPSRLRRIGLELSGRRAAREGHPILSGTDPASAETVGEVTSGSFSPTLEKPIAMGYVQPDYTAEGTELAVDIRGRCEPARVVKLPFYRRPRK